MIENADNFVMEYLHRRWDSSGMCDSCGWHDLLESYDPDEIEINTKDWSISLPCHSKNEDGSTHRGICIYLHLDVGGG